MKTFAEKPKARTVQRRDTSTSQKKDVNLIAMADHRQETPIHEHVQLMADRSLRATQIAQLQHIANSAATNRTDQSQLKQLHHGKGCECAGCTQTLTAKEQSPLLQTSTKIAGSGVVQGKWKCSNCDTEGEGKPKKKCPECGQNTLTEVSKKQSFGDWFDSLPGERRQELLRQHGSHEAEGGGQTRKNQGGGGKGNQHSDGVANAKRQIKAKYDSGEYS